MADLENVRELLDEAAVALHRADYARYSVAVGRIRQGEYLWEREPDVVEKVVTAGVALDELSERLAVRLGPDHEVVTHFRGGADALLTIQREVRRPAQMIDGVKQHEAIEAADARFDASRRAFLVAAAKIAGARLP